MSSASLAALSGVPSQPIHLLEEFSHRVINEYAVAVAELSLAAGATMSQEARVTLTHAAERLHLHAEAHRALLAPADEDQVDLADYLGRVCASMSRALLAEREVRLLAEFDEVWMDSGRCWRIGLIVAELIRNAQRHGLAGRAGWIRVALTSASGGVSCVVSDNGVGALHPTRGRGRRLIETLAGELGGVVSWRFTPAGCIAELALQDAD